jgi:hypothetical protein
VSKVTSEPTSLRSNTYAFGEHEDPSHDRNSRLLAPLPQIDRFGLAFLGQLWLTVLRQAVVNSRAKACGTEVKPSRLGRVEGVQIGHPAVTAGDRAQWCRGTLTGHSTAHRPYPPTLSLCSLAEGIQKFIHGTRHRKVLRPSLYHGAGLPRIMRLTRPGHRFMLPALREMMTADGPSRLSGRNHLGLRVARAQFW